MQNDYNFTATEVMFHNVSIYKIPYIGTENHKIAELELQCKSGSYNNVKYICSIWHGVFSCNISCRLNIYIYCLNELVRQ